MRVVYQQFSKALEEFIHGAYSIKAPLPLWEVPRDKNHGDYSTMLALKISSKVKRPAPGIAREIKEYLLAHTADMISRIEVVPPGFVNVFLSEKALGEAVASIVDEQDAFFKEQRSRSVILEFVSANPTGPLSIAHGRQAVSGDVIGRVLSFFGNTVIREYYVNDEGKQIDLLIESVTARIKEIQGERAPFPENGYKGAYIKEVARKALDASPDDIRVFVLSTLLSLIKDDLASLDISFSRWESQHELIQSGAVDDTIEALRKKGLVYSKEGAIWFSATRFGDDKDRVLRKSDGELTYFASDIAYHKHKIERGAQALINLWGPDHHGYIKRVKSVIKALGYDEELLSVLIIQLVSLTTKEKMSKRKGTAILLKELVTEVGPDAARLYYLLRRNSSPLEFDIELAKSLSFDNPLYYIQYAHARICSIFKKAGILKASSPVSADEAVSFSHQEEVLLARDIVQFSLALDKVYYTLEPVYLVEYLKYIAASFHRFYERVRVLSEDANERATRLSLLAALKTVIATGLGLLGITPKEEM